MTLLMKGKEVARDKKNVTVVSKQIVNIFASQLTFKLRIWILEYGTEKKAKRSFLEVINRNNWSLHTFYFKKALPWYSHANIETVSSIQSAHIGGNSGESAIRAPAIDLQPKMLNLRVEIWRFKRITKLALWW